MPNKTIAIAAGGDDMSPAISPGERLIIEEAGPGEIRGGDVIVFKRHVPIAHRVVWSVKAFGSAYFFTKGDLCPYIDSPVHERELIGRVAGKSLHSEVGLRNKLLLSAALLGYLALSKLLTGRAFRVANLQVRRLASFGLGKFSPGERSKN